MRFAERAKQKLSKEYEYTIHEEEAFEDHDDEPVTIDVTLTRQQLEKMLEPWIEQTMEISERAIAKAGLKASDIDRVIMVGGSSRIPILKQRLAERLSCTPELVNGPDLIVARGAAVKAVSMVGAVVEGITFLTDLPKKCPLEYFDVNARVTLENPAGLNVHIERDDGGFEADTVTDDEGRFAFQDVDLVEEEENTFEITVGDIGSPIAGHMFKVRQHPEETDSSVPIGTNFVTKDISFLLADGMKPVFLEGEHIPSEKMEILKTVNDDETFLVFRVFNGNQEIGEVRINEIPDGLPRGSELKVNIAISDDLTIGGTATLAMSNQPVPFFFKLPKPKLQSLDDMKAELKRLKSEFSEIIETVTDNMLKMEFFGKGQRQIKELDAQFDNMPCDETRIFRLLGEFNTFITELTRIDVLEPAWEGFEDKIMDARKEALALEAESEKARRADFQKTIDGIETFGRQAYEKKDKQAWGMANKQIDDCLKSIEDIRRDEIIDSLTPEQRAVLRNQSIRNFYEFVKKEIDETGRYLQDKLTLPDKADYIKYEPDLNNLVRMFNQVNMSQTDSAYQELQQIKTKLEKLRIAIDRTGGLVSANP